MTCLNPWSVSKTMWSLSNLSNLATAQLWQVTVVAALVSLVSHLLRAHRWHPSIANALWLLVLAKALTPPIVASPTGIFSWTLGTTPVNGTISSIQTSDLESARTNLWFIVLGSVWFAGFLASLATCYGNWRRLQTLIKSTTPPGDAEFEQQVSRLSTRIGIRRAPPIYLTSADLGPALVGVFRPRVVLPLSLVQQTSWDEVEPIIAHELLHLRRRDTAVSALQLLANAVWWFHPLVLWAGKQVEEASERCVDLAVLHVAGCDPAVYCRSLVKVLESRCERAQRLLASAPAVRGFSATCQRVLELADMPSRPKLEETSVDDDARVRLCSCVTARSSIEFASANVFAGTRFMFAGTGRNVRRLSSQ